MTEHDHPTEADTATETHHEPNGSTAPHGAHAEAEDLGPVDIRAWTAGALGVALGLIVVACLVVANQPVG